jgi:methylmalonyl-CoA/ethylmalonyl-CoA epimerase
MNRLWGLLAIVLGGVIGVVGALPTRWVGGLNGLGGNGHLTADVVVGVGIVLVLLGLVGLLRPPAAGMWLPSRRGAQRNQADLQEGNMNRASASESGSFRALPFGFHQISWLVRDIDAAERFFVDTVGVPKFFKLQEIRAADVHGTYQGRPGDWSCDFYLGYHGDLQIELVRHLAGTSIFADWHAAHGDGVHHIAYRVDDFEAARAYMESAGFPMVQSFDPPGGKVAYYDTVRVLGIFTEIIWQDAQGRALFEQIKTGAF